MAQILSDSRYLVPKQIGSLIQKELKSKQTKSNNYKSRLNATYRKILEFRKKVLNEEEVNEKHCGREKRAD